MHKYMGSPVIPLRVAHLVTFLFIFCTFGFSAKGEDGFKPTIKASLDVRADFSVVDTLNCGHSPNNGFSGRYLNLRVEGYITPKLRYSVLQCLNKLGATRNDVFAGTNWAWLRYDATDHFAIAGGKQVVLIGGYEYDAPPIDIYFASRYWNNVACYQFGASASWSPNKNHEITAQVCNSPLLPIDGNGFAYNLFWSGKMGCFSTLWSVNAIEYERGYFANYIALGNRLQLGNFDLQIDLMNRHAGHHKFIAGDYTVIGKASYQVSPSLSVFAKGGYDEYKLNPSQDEHVDRPFFGGGVEFFPLKNKNLRIHASWNRGSDNNGTRINNASVGLRWKVDLVK